MTSWSTRAGKPRMGKLDRALDSSRTADASALANTMASRRASSAGVTAQPGDTCRASSKLRP